MASRPCAPPWSAPCVPGARPPPPARTGPRRTSGVERKEISSMPPEVGLKPSLAFSEGGVVWRGRAHGTLGRQAARTAHRPEPRDALASGSATAHQQRAGGPAQSCPAAPAVMRTATTWPAGGTRWASSSKSMGSAPAGSRPYLRGRGGSGRAAGRQVGRAPGARARLPGPPKPRPRRRLPSIRLRLPRAVPPPLPCPPARSQAAQVGDGVQRGAHADHQLGGGDVDVGDPLGHGVLDLGGGAVGGRTARCRGSRWWDRLALEIHSVTGCSTYWEEGVR